MRSFFSKILFIGLIGLIFATVASAKIGVGVGLGKVAIDEQLAPGGIYNLPVLPVSNTGDEVTDYEIEVTFQSGQEEFRPENGWFDFTPQAFSLEPGELQQVGVKLNLPVKTRPGDYFAYLEAHPVVKAEGTTIGVAAATKLYFTVKPSGVLGAITERVRSLVEDNSPYSYWVMGGLTLGVLFFVLRRFLSLELKLKKKDKGEKADR